MVSDGDERERWERPQGGWGWGDTGSELGVSPNFTKIKWIVNLFYFYLRNYKCLLDLKHERTDTFSNFTLKLYLTAVIYSS